MKLNVLRSGPLDDAERALGENTLRRLREGWRQKFERNRGSFCGGPHLEGIFGREWQGDLTETRLFVLEFPELAEAWAQGSIEPTAAAAWERYKALNALCLLAELRFGAAESVLLRLCREGDEFIRWGAGFTLCMKKEHGALRRQLSREGEYLAIEALSYWPDAESLEWCQESSLKRQGIDDRRGACWSAERVRFRLEALASEAWEELVRQTIGGGPFGPYDASSLSTHFHWALWIARERRAPWLEKTLRARVEDIMKDGLVRFEVPPLISIDPGYGIVDRALMALAELGDPLDEKELAYLRYYGYRCEPRKRLAEILDEKNYPR